MTEIVIKQPATGNFKSKRGEEGMRTGGHESGGICGVDPTTKPDIIYIHIASQIDPSIQDLFEPPSAYGEAAKKYGQRNEPLLAVAYAELTGLTVRDGNYWKHPKLPELFGVAPDRKVYNSNNEFIGILEIKAAYGTMYTEPKPNHITQMMMELWIIRYTHPQITWCDYFVQKRDEEEPEKTVNPETLYCRVHHSAAYEKWMTPRLFYFAMCLMNRVRPNNIKIVSEAPPAVKIEYIDVYNVGIKD